MVWQPIGDLSEGLSARVRTLELAFIATLMCCDFAQVIDFANYANVSGVGRGCVTAISRTLPVFVGDSVVPDLLC